MKLDPNAPASTITVRQHFAAMAMQGFAVEGVHENEAARLSVKYADALIAQLNKEGEK